MKTEVIMKRELFGYEISQSSKTGYFNATELKAAGDKWRLANQMPVFNLSQYLNTKPAKEFIQELTERYPTEKIIIQGRGRNSATWVHPLLFIDIALAISPKLKIEVYEWIFDNLIKYRNKSGDSYLEVSGALFTRHKNHRTFSKFIQKVVIYIKEQLGVKDWQTATELQLRQRDKVHSVIKLYCKVLTDVRQIVRLAVEEGKQVD